MNDIAPVVIFTYKRLDTLIKTIQALKKNQHAPETDLFIYSDGPKGPEDQAKVEQVRAFNQTVSGFKSVTLIDSTINRGLANSVISGTTEVLNKYRKVIVMEDDLVTSPDFLSYMNQALTSYQNNGKIFSISGYSPALKARSYTDYDVFFSGRLCSWGWGMWKDRWDTVDWEVKDFEGFKVNRAKQREFNSLGQDLSRMLFMQMEGKIDSWAIRCSYSQFKQKGYTVYPKTSKIMNIGFGDDASHTFILFNRFKVNLEDDPKIRFNLPEDIVTEKDYELKFKRKYSFAIAAFYYVVNRVLKLLRKLSSR